MHCQGRRIYWIFFKFFFLLCFWLIEFFSGYTNTFPDILAPFRAPSPQFSSFRVFSLFVFLLTLRPSLSLFPLSISLSPALSLFESVPVNSLPPNTLTYQNNVRTFCRRQCYRPTGSESKRLAKKFYANSQVGFARNINMYKVEKSLIRFIGVDRSGAFEATSDWNSTRHLLTTGRRLLITLGGAHECVTSQWWRLYGWQCPTSLHNSS